MKQNWKIKTLGEICSIVKDKPPPFEGEKKYFSTGDINNNKKYTYKFIKYKNKPSRANLYPSNNDVGFAKMKGTNKVFKINEQLSGSVFSTGFCILRCSDKINNNFLYWYLLSDSFQKMKNYFSGDGIMGGIGNVNIKKVQINVPDINTQKKVVAKLDECFESIDKARENVEMNLQNAKDLFQSQLNEIFSQKGDGWEEKNLSQIGIVQTGTTPPTKDKTNYGSYIPFVKPPHFNSDGSINAGDSMLSKSGLEKGRLFPPNSVLMVCIGATIGKTGFTEIPISSNQQINCLTPEERYNSKFFYYGLISPFVQKQVADIGKGSQATLPFINKSKWQDLRINIPKNKETQDEVVKILESLKAKTISVQLNYQQELDALDELKKSILEKAFNGEL